MMDKGRRLHWSLSSLGLILLSHLLSVSAADDWEFTSKKYQGRIKECPGLSCDMIYVTTSERMGVPLPHPDQVETVLFKIINTNIDMFDVEAQLIGDFAFMFIRTRPITENQAILNREARSSYRLDVRASVILKGGRVAISNSRVNIAVIDVNDALPLFAQRLYNFTVLQSADVFSTIGKVKASDADEGINGEIYYSFQDLTNEFAVHPTTGEIYLTQNPKNLGRRKYTMKILADNRGRGRSTSASVIINIVKTNNHSPRIIYSDMPPVNGYTAPGTTILTLQVVDADSDFHGEIDTTTIVSVTSEKIADAKDYFRLTYLSGAPPPHAHRVEYKLSVSRSPLDLGNQVNITIQSWDKGDPVRSTSVTIPLSIRLQDNEQTEQTIKLDIDEGLPEDTPLHYISPPRGAIDMTYRMVEDPLGSFRIHSRSGVLFLAKQLDAENVDQTNLEVSLTAKFSDGQRVENKVKFEITVNDENDNKPEFATPIEKPLPENSPIGTVATIASATDKDDGANSEITYSISYNEDSTLPFEIDAFIGEIRLTGPLDYELDHRLYHIPVRASDRGAPYRRETEKIFTVAVENVNDMKPMFEYDQCTVSMAKDLAIGSRVRQFKALDIDSDDTTFSYSIRITDTQSAPLTIDENTGMITTYLRLDGLSQRRFIARVTASDGINLSEPVKLTVIIGERGEVPDGVKVVCTPNDARKTYDDFKRTAAIMNPSREDIILPSSNYLSNNHRPKFDNKTNMKSYWLPEDLPTGSIVGHLSATDQDSGFAGLIQYKIQQGNAKGHFAINDSTGALIVFAPLDREAHPQYNLSVVAMDMDMDNRKSAALNIIIDVIDSNDNTPKFLRESYEAYINETIKRGTSFLQVMARDLDEGNNGKIEYSLVTDTPYFLINSATGMVMVKAQLDRETKDRHVLEVRATDKPVDPSDTRFAMTTVVIHITDVNDNPPVFMKKEFRVKVREDMPKGTVITNLVAHDADLPASGGEVTYKIQRDDDAFSIDKNTGVVRLITKLDYEVKNLYRLPIRARDNGTDPLRTTCDLVVEVMDVNENLHTPRFDMLVYNGTIEESAIPGQRVLVVRARDSDVGQADSKVSYSIQRGSGLGIFTVDSKTGIIRTATQLDRETVSSYWLTVYAQDQGTVPMSSSVEVYISVSDVNDNPPETDQPVYYVSVPENSAANRVVKRIRATDMDSQSDISYSISGGNTQSLFSINSRTGEIKTTRRRIDRESLDRHTLEVTINDGGIPEPLTSTVQVIVTISDENDNRPQWQNKVGSLQVSLLNSHDRRKPVYRIVASDEDTGVNGEITYSLPQAQAKNHWRIDSATGEIYLKRDWPTEDEIIIKVEAKDGGEIPQVSQKDIKFTINKPVIGPNNGPLEFDQSEKSYALQETAPVFDLLDFVYAEGGASDEYYYSIADGGEYNGYPMFMIDPKEGIVQVAGRLDYESKSEYNLNISVTDGQSFANCMMKVSLTNVNEYQPWFTQRVYNITVRENIPVGTDVLTVRANDQDMDVLAYRIISQRFNTDINKKLFDMDHRTGVISTMRPLDHETTRVHELIIKVNDNGVKEFSDYARVIINVEDTNDHIPRFVIDPHLDSAAKPVVRIHEMAVIGSIVKQVQATDQDKGDNARIQYSLLSGNVGYSFNIDPDLGVITLARSLDKDVRSEYELTVMANDMGIPRLSSTTLVHVLVTVADERAPMFESSSFTAELKENEPIGSFVIALSGESQSSLTYDIVDAESDFAINPNSGILTSNKMFDFEEQYLYNVTITATDIRQHSVTLVVVVHIIDENDNRPAFNQLTYVGHVSEGSPDGSVVLTDDSVPLLLDADDKDSNLNALLLYSILEPEARVYFRIDSNTGAIRTATTPNRELKGRFEFTVQVQDQGEESLSAANPARVIITVDDINDTPPSFSQSSYQTTLLTPTYKGVILHTLEAYDPDLNSDLFYELTNGNTADKFSIEHDTGVVYVSDPGNLLTDYNLGIKVSDGVHEASYTLTVKVQQTSDSGLVFSESQYTGEVQENRTTEQTILIVQPMNLDLHEPVSFELLNHREEFKIGMTSGVLETKQGAVLDREEQSSFEVIVRVRTGGRSKRLAQVPVTVTVSDVNDNVPYFTKETYYATVMVSANKGSYVTKVLAIDSDVGNNRLVRYEIEARAENYFRISKKTGEITVKRLLTDHANREFTLVVTAKDQGEPSLSSTANVVIKVFTASTPNFTQVLYESSIPENIPLSSAVTRVSAISPNDNKIIYSIADGDPNNEFTVQFSTAMEHHGPCTLRVNDDLDYESTKQYRLKIRAIDVVTSDWSDAIVIINVQDVNDQKPVFDDLDYYTTVSEATTVGTEVLSLTATDLDQGINSQIHYSLAPITEGSNAYQMFDIEESAGVAHINTVSALDHELYQKLDFIIVATDGGNPRLSSQAYIHVQLTDLNDNAPLFENSTYYVEISDQVTKGQFVAMVAAIDVDKCNEGELMYNIVHGNEGQAFSINQRSGSVYVSPFHQTTSFNDLYMLNVSVSDGIFTSFTSLAISINRANRHTPEFDSILYNIRVLENATVGTTLGTVLAEDEDVGRYGQVTYSLIGDQMMQTFRVQPDTGDVILRQSLDRERKDFYMIPVMAQDKGGRTSFTSVYVNVKDVNDNAPQFYATSYGATVRSNSTANTPVIRVLAFDLDGSNNVEKDSQNAVLSYSIISDGEEIVDTFTINNVTGQISLIRDLIKSDDNKEKEFFVRVADNGDIPLDATSLVSVTFSSLSDLPSFSSEQISVFVDESEEIGAEVTRVKADYNGGHELSYRIKGGSSPSTNKPASFVIDNEGRITTFTSLDAENEGKYNLVVEAFLNTIPEQVSTMLVSISPIDSNDNPPTFTSEEYEVSVAENTPIGSNILQVSADDIDQDHKTGILYSFAPESASYSNLFLINRAHGWISTLVPLDRETRPTYEFYVQASDEDGRGSLNSTAKVIVNLLDVNDCAPEFPQYKLMGGVRYWNDTAAAVSEDAPNGTIVVQVRTTDADLPDHSTKMYYISGGNEQGHFRIKQTGEIFVSKPLDREHIKEYHLEVSATDGVFVTSIMVMVAVLDTNDNAPVCERALYTKTMPEDIESGTLVLTIKASDRDEAKMINSNIMYSLRGEGADDFAIDSLRGDIRVNKRLDSDVTPVYRLSGVATDGGGLECMSDIELTLTDVNDNNPVFDDSVYRHVLPEDSVNNTLLLRVTATDKDAGLARKVQYSLLSGATDMFAIDPYNGIVRLIKPVKREQGESYTVVIAATDQGTPTRTGTADLVVQISDVNDPPVFQNSVYDKSVSEDIVKGTTLLQVQARSTDTGLNNVIRYKISNGGANNELFIIHPVTGVLSTAGNFDYELVREYVLNIEAQDAGDPPLSDTCMVTVTVTDANDNKPTFSQLTYTANVREDSKVEDQIIQIRAQDLDSGLNADITYSIKSGDDLRQFSINSRSGFISVAAPLDREAISEYRLVIQAADSGAPRQISTVLLIVSITDINDNVPVFSQTNYTAQVQVYPEGNLYRNTTFLLTSTQTPPTSSESTNPDAETPMSSYEDGQGDGYSPLTLAVTDADASPNNGPFKYTIISGNDEDKFSVDENGLLVAHGTFDMKKRRIYMLQVKVDDGGVPPLSSTTFVKLEVHEATLHPPVVATPRNFTVVAYEDTFPGGVIGHVVARDPDFDKLQYGLVSPHLQRQFSMDRNSGAFSSYSLDSGTYVLNISATDGRFTKYGVIEVKVVSITDEMMSQSVGIRIERLSAAEFVSTLKRSFETALSGLSPSIRKIHILSITEDSSGQSARTKRQTGQSRGGIVVLVAAEKLIGDMMTKERLATYIRDNKDRVESILGGVDIGLPADDFVCSPEIKCNSDEKCDMVYQITQDKVTIHSDQQSFVSLLAKPQEKCVCLGPTCVNPCSANPCPRHKTCVPGASPQSYSCECPAGTFGVDCDLHDGSPLAFNGDSYARWTLVKDIKTRLQVRLTFRTKQSDAVLMDARGDRDYSTLELVDGKVQYTFECGSGPASMITGENMNDGNWHNITLERNGNFARLLLDKGWTAQAESDRNTVEINLKDKNVYFGAIVKTLSNGQIVKQAGFKGCMKDIQIDRVPLPYTDTNSAGGDFTFPGVEFECHESFYGVCSINPCLNGGTCLETGNRVQCSCKGYEGSRCEKDLDECSTDNPCAAGATCENTLGDYICHCPYGKTGKQCYQNDECLSSPCEEDRVCKNIHPAEQIDKPYECVCADDDDVCKEKVTKGPMMPPMHIVYISAAALGLILIIVIIVVVARCVITRRRRQKEKAPLGSCKSEREAMYYPRGARGDNLYDESQDLYPSRAPSPPPPSVPPRPASYTPSANDTGSASNCVNEGAGGKGKKTYEMSHDYGSAADGLDRIALNTFTQGYGDVHVVRPNPTRATTTFAALPKLTPPPPSVSDTDSIRKPAWDFDYPTNETGRDMLSARGSDRLGRSAGVHGLPSHLSSRAGSKAGSKANSRHGSKPASITNGSIASIPLEDEGYHWDTSDWVPVREDGSAMGPPPEIRNRNRGDGDNYHVARLLSMSEVDDSEYVEDSELDDDTIPQISAPSYNVDDILALQAQYKLDYDLPDLNIPKSNPNHYLPRHGSGGRRDDISQPLLMRAAPGISIPAVPQRTASLSYSNDDLVAACLPDESTAAGLEGYTSMEADDTQSEMSENICDIDESDCETDMEGIMSRVKNDKFTHV